MFPEGWRRAAVDGGRGRRRAEPGSLDPLDAGGAGGVRAARRGPARSRAAICRNARRPRAAGAEVAPPQHGLGRRRDRLRALPEALLLDVACGRSRGSAGPAARIGTEVHRWIERRSIGPGQLLELDDAPDLTAEELAAEPGKVDRLRQAFLASRFAGVVPAVRRARVPPADGGLRGRRAGSTPSSASPSTARGRSSTGRPGDAPPADDPLAGLQLDLYGLACVEVWGKRPEDLTLTYLYLAGGEEVSHPMGDPDEVRARVADVAAIDRRGRVRSDPGPWCHHCDFLSFCEAGRAWVAAGSVTARRGGQDSSRSICSENRR